MRKSAVHSDGDLSGNEDEREKVTLNTLKENLMNTMENNYCAPMDQLTHVSAKNGYKHTSQKSIISQQSKKNMLAGKLGKLKWILRQH